MICCTPLNQPQAFQQNIVSQQSSPLPWIFEDPKISDPESLDNNPGRRILFATGPRRRQICLFSIPFHSVTPFSASRNLTTSCGIGGRRNSLREEGATTYTNQPPRRCSMLTPIIEQDNSMRRQPTPRPSSGSSQHFGKMKVNPPPLFDPLTITDVRLWILEVSDWFATQKITDPGF